MGSLVPRDFYLSCLNTIKKTRPGWKDIPLDLALRGAHQKLARAGTLAVLFKYISRGLPTVFP